MMPAMPVGEDDRPLTTTAPIAARHVSRFSELALRERNFVPLDFREAITDPRWRVDERHGVLGEEPPGPPLADGPYAQARRGLIDYAFADPGLVRAVYDASVPLEGRDMLLVGRFFGLRFPMGVRVGGVEEDVEVVRGRRVHRFSWHYDTLQGHLEQGRMCYQLRKWEGSGLVELRLRAYSRRAPIRNPVVALGFALFGRAVQLRFYDRVIACVRGLAQGAPSASTRR